MKQGSDLYKPIVSVIMPTYNCGNYIINAIESVKYQNVNWELIIIDDASYDSTQEKVKKYTTDYRIHYVRHRYKQGVAKSRNEGVLLAKGKFIAYLDADDWWEKNKLDQQLKCMKNNQYILCYTARKLFDQRGRDLNKIINVKKFVNYKTLLLTNCISCSSVLMRKETALKFPMQHDKIHEDYLNWLSILKNCKNKVAYGLSEPLLCSRLTKNGKSRRKIKTIYKTYAVYQYLNISKFKSCWFLINHLIRSIFRYL